MSEREQHERDEAREVARALWDALQGVLAGRVTRLEALALLASQNFALHAWEMEEGEAAPDPPIPPR
jgi:hypothetical protein